MNAEQVISNGEPEAAPAPTRDDAIRILSAQREGRVQKCNEELASILTKYRCSLASHQEFINGMPKGPANIILVAND